MFHVPRLSKSKMLRSAPLMVPIIVLGALMVSAGPAKGGERGEGKDQNRQEKKPLDLTAVGEQVLRKLTENVEHPVLLHLEIPPENRRTLRRLEQRISVHFEKEPLPQVIDHLSEVTGVEFVVMWRALAAALVNHSTKLTLELEQTPTRRVLELVLAKVSGPVVHLGWRIREGVVTISTERDLKTPTVTVIYDVRQLVAPPDRNRRLAAGRQGQEAAGQRRPRLAPGGLERPARLTPGAMTRRGRALMSVIRTVINPESWRVHGGLVGTGQYFNGLLVVSQTRETHRQIFSLLTRIRTRGSRADAATVKELLDPVDVGFSDTPLTAVIDRFREMSGVNFFINRRRLHEAGVSPDAPVTLRLHGVPLGVALTLALDAAGEDLTWSIQEGVVIVSTSR